MNFTRPTTEHITHGMELLSTFLERIKNSIRNISSSSVGVTEIAGQIRAGQADSANLGGFLIGGSNPEFGKDGIAVGNDGYDGWCAIRPSRWPSSMEMAIMPTPRAGLCRTVAGSEYVTVLQGPMPKLQDIGKPIWIYNQVAEIVAFDENTKVIKLSVAQTVSKDRTYTICYNWGRGTCTTVAGGNFTSTSGDCFSFTPGIKVHLEELGTWHDYTFIDSRNGTLSPAPPAGTYTYFWWSTVDQLASAFRIHRVADAGYEENLSIIASNRGYYEIHAMAKDFNHEQYPIFIGSGWEGVYSGGRHTFTADGNGDAIIGGHYAAAGLRITYNNRDVNANRFAIFTGSTGTTPELAAEGGDANISIRLRPKGTGTNVLEGGAFVNGVSYLNGRVEHTNELHPSTDGVLHLGRNDRRYDTVHAVNGVSTTSDGREKDIAEISKLEIEVGLRLAKSMIKFRWNNKVDDKIHFGIIAQEIILAFEDANLDPLKYGLVSYDKDADLYSVNYAELNAFCIMALAHK